MVFTYIFAATTTEVSEATDLTMLLDLTDDSNRVVGQSMAHDMLRALVQVCVPDVVTRCEISTTLGNNPIYYFDVRLARYLAHAPLDDLYQLSVRLVETAPIGVVDVNPFDLAGFLVELAGLCQKAEELGQRLYLVHELDFPTST